MNGAICLFIFEFKRFLMKYLFINVSIILRYMKISLNLLCAQ